MTLSRVEQIIRHFRENGLKLLLEHPASARELLVLTAPGLLGRLEFARITVDPTSYVAADYRHLASDMIPDLDPLHVNLPDVAPATLEAAGPLGWVLELIQQRRARPEEFRALVVRVVQRLEEMPAQERQRWLELLSYVQALVYHDREVPEREGLREVIADSVRTDERRREVKTMGQTIAEALREEGRQEGLQRGAIRALQQTLLNVLRAKFGRVPRATVRVIHATQDPRQLDAWVTRTVTATSLDDMGIGPAR